LKAQSEQKPIKNFRRVAVGRLRASRKFLGHPYTWLIARLSLR